MTALDEDAPDVADAEQKADGDMYPGLEELEVPADPGEWTLFEAIDVRKALGYTRENWQQALSETPELMQIGAAWLEARKRWPGITPQTVASRVRTSQLRAPDPKAKRS